MITSQEKIQFAVIGGGVIGGGWVARFLLMGFDVKVFDPDPDAEKKINQLIENARRSLPGLFEYLLPDEGTLTFCSNINIYTLHTQKFTRDKQLIFRLFDMKIG